MNLFSFKQAFDGFKKRRREKKLTEAIQERRYQLRASSTIDYAFLGYDFLCFPNLEEDTALVSYVVDGKVIIKSFPLKEYLAMAGALYNFYFPSREDDGTRFLIEEDSEPYKISEEQRRLIEEEKLQEKLEQLRTLAEELRQKGISEELIQLMTSPQQKLSGLHISSDLQVITKSGRQEKLDLRPLPKALYLLFLKHPEGIAFKDLVDYRDELLAIYNRLSPKKGNQNEKSIDDLVDPTNNSANEKCSRIRAAFVKLFDEATARHYYIDGKRGEKKKIDLDRKLVSWEE